MHLADGEFLQGTENREQSLKLQNSTQIPVISKTEGRHFKIKQEMMHRDWPFCLRGLEALDF
jgi:hypothetical protein